MRRIPGPVGTLAVEEHGDGPLPLVLVHGMAGDASFWGSMVRALGPGHRVVIPELRGHGRSAQATSGDYSIEGCAADVEAVLEQLALERVVLVGHSFGASVVMAVAAATPERVAGVLLLDPAGDFSYVPPEALSGFLAGLDHEGRYAETVEGAFDVALEGSTPETERRVRAALLSAPRPMIRAMYHSLLRFRPLVALGKYSGPLLLIRAPANAAPFALHLLRPATPTAMIDGVSHWLMLDHPKAVARMLEDFLARL